MLVNQPAIELVLYVSSRDPKGRLRSQETQTGATPCEFIGDLISSYSSMPRDPIYSHRMQGRDIVQRLLALLDQRRLCSNGLKSFQGRLTIRANTNAFLRSILKLNFISTDQDGIYLGLENSRMPAQGEAEPSSYKLPIDFSPRPPLSWTHL
jgi:hypothetical protein